MGGITIRELPLEIFNALRELIEGCSGGLMGARRVERLAGSQRNNVSTQQPFQP